MTARPLLCILLLMALSVPSAIPMMGAGLNHAPGAKIGEMDISFLGNGAGDYFGMSVAGVGDVTGDGFPDILIGTCTMEQQGNGQGPGGGGGGTSGDGGNTGSASGSGSSGSSSAGNGGQNPGSGGGPGTGQPGGGIYPSQYGHVYLIFGKPTFDLGREMAPPNVDVTFVGETTHELPGCQIAAAGDVNGDGLKDFLIGSHLNNESGYASGTTYLIIGRPDNQWPSEFSVADADASFIGAHEYDEAGFSVSGAGDVNGDGFDDILIGAFGADGYRGETALIFGRASGWAMDVNISSADVLIRGDNPYQYSGYSTAGVGDVNGDGYDDIMIGAPNDAYNYYSDGKAFLIFGKASGWEHDIGLEWTNPDASFVSPYRWTSLGQYVGGAGDLNGDGYDDIIIGGGNAAYIYLGKSTGWTIDTEISTAEATFSDINRAAGAGDVNGDGFDDLVLANCYDSDRVDTGGKVHIFLGKSNNWVYDTYLADAEATFTGEAAYDELGYSVDGLGDLDLDGFDEVLVSAPFNNKGGTDAGEVYIIDMQDKDRTPTFQGPSISIYSDPECTDMITTAGMNQTVYVEMVNQDNRVDRKESELVMVTSSKSSPNGFRLQLVEDGADTGRFRGYFTVSSVTSMTGKGVAATPWETVYVTLEDPRWESVASFWVIAPITLHPQSYGLVATEDVPYIVEYSSTEAPGLAWQFQTNASWLTWDPETHTLSGTPTNEHVGSYQVRVRVQQTYGPYDEHNFTLKVKNTLPEILTEVLPDAVEGTDYFVDLRSTDDSGARVSWKLATDAGTWLAIDPAKGILSGVPGNDDVGSWNATVTVDDGNGGKAVRKFNLNVKNLNNAPRITSIDDRTAREHERYYVTYEASDIDVGDTLEWRLDTNASWLSLNPLEGRLFGTPENCDIGSFRVEITVKDAAGAKDSHRFTLTVVNVNDPPKITSVPEIETDTYVEYEYWVRAKDIDVGDVITYSLSSGPEGMTIDPASGQLLWTPTDAQIGKNYVVIAVSDGTTTVYQDFKIKVERAPGKDWPMISSAPGRKSLQVGDTFSYQVLVDDEDVADTFSYIVINGPHGMSVTEDGLITWPVGEGNAGENYDIVILVIDSYGFEDEQRFTLHVSPYETAQEPTVRDHLMSIHVEGLMLVIIGLGMVAAARRLMPRA